jgi:hypothetical protein
MDRGVSIVNGVPGTVTSVHLSQNGPHTRWKSPAHIFKAALLVVIVLAVAVKV